MIWDYKTKGHINAIQRRESKDKKLRTEYKREEKMPSITIRFHYPEESCQEWEKSPEHS